MNVQPIVLIARDLTPVSVSARAGKRHSEGRRR